MLTADLVMLPGMTFSWARELMNHQIDYAKKYPSQEFVGISINASGDADEIPLADFLKQATIPEGAKPKLIEALQEGVDTIRVVKKIEDAVSADLVTSPGARGRILDFIEQEKKQMAKKMKHNEDEQEDKKSPADMAPQKENEDEADDSSEKAYQAYQAYREMGEDEEEAAKSAGKAVKLHNYAKKKQAEADADGDKEQESENAKIGPAGYEFSGKEAKKRESAVTKLVARVSFLEREIKTRDLIGYMDRKLKETGLYRDETNQIRKIVGTPKSKEHVDSTVRMFVEAYRAGKASVADGGLVMSVEKSHPGETGLDFSDCAD